MGTPAKGLVCYTRAFGEVQLSDWTVVKRAARFQMNLVRLGIVNHQKASLSRATRPSTLMSFALFQGAARMTAWSAR